MRLLLDTHTFLWYYSGSSEFSEHAKVSIDNPKNEFWVSMATMWEISIKNSLGKLDLDKSFDEFCQDAVSKGFNFLPIDMAHLIASTKLPFYHRDPFDRILVAQAISEKLNFVSKDEIMSTYFENEDVNVFW